MTKGTMEVISLTRQAIGSDAESGSKWSRATHQRDGAERRVTKEVSVKRLTCYALVLACVVGLTVLAQGTNVLTLGKSEELTSLDPQNHFNRTCFMLYRLVYGGLTDTA